MMALYKYFRISMVLILAFPATSVIAENKFDENQIEKDVNRIYVVMKQGDYKSLVFMTHPVIVDLMGGYEEAIKQIEGFMNTAEMQSLKLGEVYLIKPFTFVEV